MKAPAPFLSRVARWLLDDADAERLFDALDEEYAAHKLAELGRRGADRWYRRQVIRSIRPLRKARTRTSSGRMRLDVVNMARSWRRAPIGTLATVTTLALTVGVGATILAVAHQVLLRPLPYVAPEDIVLVGGADPGGDDTSPEAVGWTTLEAWRDDLGGVVQLEAYDPSNVTMAGGGAARRISVMNVTPGFLGLLGVGPTAGRGFVAADDGLPLLLLTSGFAELRFPDRDPVGQALILDGVRHEVIGVLPDSFSWELNRPAALRPLSSATASLADDRVRAVGRLAAGRTVAELGSLLDALPPRGLRPPALVRAVELRRVLTQPFAPSIRLLALAAAAALLIAFGNLAGLMAVRAVVRRREFAVRRALGASAQESGRQLLLESLAMTVLGVLGGLALAAWSTPKAFAAGASIGLPVHGVSGLDPATFMPVVMIALLLGCFAAWLPTVASGRTAAVLTRRGHGASRRETALRRAFAVGQVALAFTLLVGVTLLGGALVGMLRIDPGFDPDGVVKVQLSLPAADYPDALEVDAFNSELVRAVANRLPGARVALADEVPLTGDGGRTVVRRQGGVAEVRAVGRSVSAGYFDVLLVEVVAGRTFFASDDADSSLRVVLSAVAADRLFGGEPAVGAVVELGPTLQLAEVVGIVGDVMHRSLDEAPQATAYLHLAQDPSASQALLVRSDRPTSVVVDVVREEVARLDPTLPIYGVESLEDVVRRSPGVPLRRVIAVTMAAFAVLAVALATIGLFGVIAQDVARRRTDIAVRMAVGAPPGRILRSTLGRSLGTVLLGLGIGGVATLLVLPGFTNLLGPLSWTRIGSSVVGVGILITLTGVGATTPVAIRAARRSPSAALGDEG